MSDERTLPPNDDGTARLRTPTELAAVLNASGVAARPSDGPVAATTAASDTTGSRSAAPEGTYEPAMVEERVRDLRMALAAGEGIADLLLFQVGRELFAAELGSVDEAIDLDVVERLPEMPPAQLGILTLRDGLIPLFAPDRALGTNSACAVAAALVVRPHEREDAPRVAIAIDDVIDAVTVDVSTIGDPPSLDDPHSILVGIIRLDADLIAVIDARALVAACLADRAEENA